MDPLRLAVAAGGLVFIVLLIWSDWRVRSARALVLLVVALGAAVVAAVTDSVAFPVVWVIAGAVLVLLVYHPRWLAPLDPADLGMVERIESVERSLVRTSDAYRKGQLPVTELHEKFAQIRRRVARMEPPDDDWRAVIGLIPADIDKTMATIAGKHHRSREDVQRDRQRFRLLYRDLVKKRLRFWR